MHSFFFSFYYVVFTSFNIIKNSYLSQVAGHFHNVVYFFNFIYFAWNIWDSWIMNMHACCMNRGYGNGNSYRYILEEKIFLFVKKLLNETNRNRYFFTPRHCEFQSHLEIVISILYSGCYFSWCRHTFYTIFCLDETLKSNNYLFPCHFYFIFKKVYLAR